MVTPARLIESVGEADQVRRYYDRKSRHYDDLLEPLERRARLLGLDRAGIKPLDRVLEVAVGTGATLVEIARRLDPGNVVQGVDLSPGMLQRAREKAQTAGLRNIELRGGDARRLPFPDETFDVLYNSYMLDLIHLADMPAVLGEFQRVLRPGGRMVLVNLSKRHPDRVTVLERLYRWLPERMVPRLVGLCRPVAMADQVAAAGFEEVSRQYLPGLWSSEIVLARKPGQPTAVLHAAPESQAVSTLSHTTNRRE